MKFTTPCFVRVEDAEKRKELTEWLEGIGYYVCSCCLFGGCNTLHCCGIDRLKIAYEVHGICDYDEEPDIPSTSSRLKMLPKDTLP